MMETISRFVQKLCVLHDTIRDVCFVCLRALCTCTFTCCVQFMFICIYRFYVTTLLQCNCLIWLLFDSYTSCLYFQILYLFHHSPKLNPSFSFTVRMLNDTCLPIRQIKICQPQKISNLPNFDSSNYIHCTVN